MPACYLATVSEAARRWSRAASTGASGSVLLTAAPRSGGEADRHRCCRSRPRSRRARSGPLAACEAFARVWRERTGQAHVLALSFAAFRTDRRPVYVAAPGELRLPESREHDLIADWQVAFIDEVGLPDDRARARRNRRAAHRARACPRLGRWRARWRSSVSARVPAATARIAPVYTLPRLSWPRLRVGDGRRACRANCSPRASVRYF